MCPDGMPLPMLLQTCRHNFLDKVKVRMGAIKAHTWKEHVEQAEKAEKSAKKFEPPVPKNKWRVNTKGRDAAQPSQSEGKETVAVELSANLAGLGYSLNISSIVGLPFRGRCSRLAMIILFP